MRIDEISPQIQATATAFLERLATVPPPERTMWLKLAGMALLDSQCAALADRFGHVMTDFHLTKCMGCTAGGLRHFLEVCVDCEPGFSYGGNLEFGWEKF